jgi:cysteate synthase
MNKYYLKCTECGAEYEDDRFRLRCDQDHGPALLRSMYREKRFTARKSNPGMFKFADFLPVERMLDVEGAPVSFRSEMLAKHLGLKNLFIIFNGFWPERHARMYTASFKELEAPPVLARVPEDHEGTIVVASAGNTGRAFAHICSMNRIPLILVIPEERRDEIWSPLPYDDCVRLLLATGNSDYFDAITLAGKVTGIDGFFPEGGAANVARRDGMATTVLDAACMIGRIPDHYFQAVGSGTGGVAAWESCLRLLDDGGYGDVRMKLHLAQNAPFIPMTEAWNQGLRELPPLDEEKAKYEIHHIKAKVLSNRKPPYSLTGGVFDVLSESGGKMYAVGNDEVERAMQLFDELEGVDIHPAGGVALGALMQAVERKTVSIEDIVVLNITGGGERRAKRDGNIHYLKPFAAFSVDEIHHDGIQDKLRAVLKRSKFHSRERISN